MRWDLDWVHYVESSNESMELYVEAAMLEEAAQAVEESNRRETTKVTPSELIAGVQITVGQTDSGQPSVVLNWPAEEGKRYTIERSLDLDSWSVVKDDHLHTGPDKVSRFEDVSQKGAYFYRVTSH